MENVKLSPAQKFWKTVKSNPIVVLLVVIGIIVGFTKDNFFSWRNFGNLASNTAVRFLIALGVSGCLITKGTDLSAGRQVGFAACLAGVLLQRANYAGRLFPNMPEMNMGVVLLIVLAIGAVFGLLNGLIIAFLNVPPFIATLGTQTIIYGISLVFTDAQPIGGFQESYNNLINGCIGDPKGFYLPYLLFVAVIFGLFFWFLYNKTCHGKYMYAIGGNEIAAEVSGVNTKKAKILIYMTAGIMYAMAGYLRYRHHRRRSGRRSGVRIPEDRAAVPRCQPVLQLHGAGHRHRDCRCARYPEVHRKEVILRVCRTGNLNVLRRQVCASASVF